MGLLLIFGKGIFGSKGEPGSGTPLDVGVNPGSLDGGAVVVVTGDWVYDSGHAGWNEIHPVKSCQVMVVGLLGNTWQWLATSAAVTKR